MINQYKPSKPQKVKTSKPAKVLKQPKAPKAEKTLNFGAAKAVKLDKPKKVKEPKVIAPKPEKAVSFTPTKIEKATKFEGVGKLKKPLNPKIVAAVLVAVAVVAAAVLLAINLQDNQPVIAPQSLSVSVFPDTAYYVGETASFTGLKLKMTLTNGSSITVDGNDCEITGFDSSKPAENQTITVKYRNLQTTFSVTIEEMSTGLPDAKYTRLSFKTLPAKTTYKVGEWPDPSGGVLLVHYEDGTTREMELTNDLIYDFSTAKPGTYTITVKYVERGFYADTTYTITVTE